MINRITNVLTPGNGRRSAEPSRRPGISSPAGRAQHDLATRLGEFLGQHPVLSLSVGLTVGIVIGCITKRR